MTRIELLFHHYRRQNLSSSDYFSEITSKIPSEIPYSTKFSVVYIPVETELVELRRSQGYLIADKLSSDIEIPHYTISQMDISFDMGSDASDEDLEYLKSNYSQGKAFKCRLINEHYLENDQSPKPV